MIIWKRINLIFGLILCFGSFQVTYTILRPMYLENELKDVLTVVSIAYAGGILCYSAAIFINNIFSHKRIKFLRAYLYALIGPIISFPLLIMALETKIGLSLFILLFISLLLQRIEWNYVKSIIEDLKLSFYPHLKNGFNDFLDMREKRKHNLRN